jgi:YVTN family beta-propeller protein
MNRANTTIRRSITLLALGLVGAVFAAGAFAAAPAETQAEAATFHRHLEREGVAIDLDVKALRDTTTFREGDPVSVRFQITDTNTGQPYSSLFPAAWMDRLPDEAEAQPDSCKQKVESFVGGTLLAQPELDLNVYYVLALNNDATISVVDPLFGFGNSKLLTMAFLEEPGYDWVLTKDQRLLFVSLPKAGKVAVVSTADWKVLTSVEVGPKPGRVALQPDGEYLWVTYREPLPGADRSGVSAVDVEHLRRVANIPTGRGDHDLAFDQDDHLYVTDRADGSVSVIDTGTLQVLKHLETAADPVAIAHSPVGQAVYVTHGTSGVIAAIDTKRLEVVARIKAEPGLGDILFVPSSRLAFIVNPEADLVHVLDASARKIIQTGDVEDEPDQVGISDELAYIRHRGSDTILMIPLDEIGREGEPLPVVDFPGGQHPAGLSSMPSPARGIVQAPGATAVLVANPEDESIYYYKEGMAAPMGHFNNYGRQPRAVMVVDRSLQELEPGVYETAVTLRRPGKYDLAFFLDAPRLVHCFELEVAENPELVAERKRENHPIDVLYKMDGFDVTVGEEVAVRFELVDSVDHTPRGGRDDVEVLTFLAPGIWQKRHLAKPLEGDLYEIRFTPPRAGVYYVFVQSRSLGFGFQSSPYVTLMAGAPGATADSATAEVMKKKE